VKPIKIVKNRSDIGAGTRGSDMGVDALEIAAINYNDDFFNNYPFEDVETHNETIYNKVKCNFAKRINFVSEQCERVRDTVFKTLTDGYFPLILSGDHSSSIGTMAAINKYLDGDNFGVIWIDAHADLHTPYTTPSGNVHGMSLAAVLGIINFSDAINKVDKFTIANWNKLIKLGVSNPILEFNNIVYMGLRDMESQEKEIISKKDIKNIKVQDIRNKGLEESVSGLMKYLNSIDKIYISFDVDSLDCDLVSRGTGTPVSNGFDTIEIISIIEHMIKSDKVIAMEVSEINPLFDNRGNKMAEKTFEIIRRIFKT